MRDSSDFCGGDEFGDDGFQDELIDEDLLEMVEPDVVLVDGAAVSVSELGGLERVVVDEAAEDVDPFMVDELHDQGVEEAKFRERDLDDRDIEDNFKGKVEYLGSAIIPESELDRVNDIGFELLAKKVDIFSDEDIHDQMLKQSKFRLRGREVRDYVGDDDSVVDEERLQDIIRKEKYGGGS